MTIAPELKPLSVAQRTLLEMADYIREHGWIQGRLEDETGRVCVWGAYLAIADLSQPACTDAWHTFYYSIKRRFGCSAPMWNDTPGRTADEVLSELESCALEMS